MTKTKRRQSDLDPVFINIVHQVGFVWFVTSLVGLVVYLFAQLPRLGTSVWLYSPGGRSAAPSAYAIDTSVITVAAVVSVLLLGAFLALSHYKSRPNVSWLVILVILFSWLTTVFITIVVFSAMPQVGLHEVLTKSAAFSLIIIPTQHISLIIGAASLLSTLGISTLVSYIHKRDVE